MSDFEADTLQRFIFDEHQVRGELVHLRGSFQATLGDTDYPAVLVQQLGQALAASVLLSATIKFEGSLILQIQSAGPVKMLVTQCTDQRHVRGLARWDGEVNDGSLADMYGQGSVAITINADRQQERYQGVVALEGDKLEDAIENYFAQSEQLPTRLFLFANQEQAVGLLLQRLPDEDEEDDLWNRVNMLAETVTADEMLGLSSEEVLYRLFHEENIRLFDAEPVSFRCTCSRNKIETMIVSLGSDEAHSIVEEQGKIEVNCEFCNHQYVLDKIDVEQLFASEFTPPPPDAIQ